MANVKITELAALTTTDAATDVVAVVDVSADATKKITVTNLLTTPVETQVTTQARIYTAAQRGEITTLTDGANVSVDLSASNNYSLTLAGNRTLDNPTNIVAGQSGSIFIVQDATGSRTLAYGSYYDFAGGTAPTLSTAADAVDRIDYLVRSATSIHCVFTANYS
ncbi:hypothetical protein [uncultured Mediterranean phage uvMED]|nr:hypothetical protein [uncultured Mediterranean phage uvMED]